MTVEAQAAVAAAPPITTQAEAARYALLRRLAPSMRHHLVVNLQPIGMIYEVMDRRLKAGEPQLAEVHESAQKINGFARAALESCLDVITWLAPEEQRLTPASEGVSECLGLLTTSLTFRGFSVRNEVPALQGPVRRAAIRTVLTAALLHVTDQGAAPADLVVAAQADGDTLMLTVTLRPTDGEGSFGGEAPYRQLAWEDVQALAKAEAVKAEREGNLRVRLAIPLGAVT